MLKLLDTAWTAFTRLLVQRFYLLAVLMLAAMLVPYIYSCFFVHPFADDWGFSDRIHRMGRLPFAWDFYQHWSGRYTANTLLALPGAHIVHSPVWYSILPLLFMASVFGVILLLFRRLLPAYSAWQQFFISLAFFVFYISFLPELFSALYWNCSSYYLAALAIYLLFIWVALKHYLTGSAGMGLYVFAVILCILSGGLTEIFIFTNVLVFGAIILYRYVSTKRICRFSVIMLLVTFVSFALNIFSPGSQERMQVSQAHPSLLYAVCRAGYDFFNFHGTLFLNGFFIFSTITVWLTAGNLLRTNVDLQSIVKVHPAYVVLVTLVVFYIHHLACIVGAGYSLQGRVLNISYILFYLAVYYNILVLAYYTRKHEVQNETGFLKPLYLVIILCMFFAPNTRQLTADLYYKIPEFSRQMHARYALILQAKQAGKTEVYVPRITVNPKTFTLGFYDESKNYYNSEFCVKEMSRPFGIAIHIQGRPDETNFKNRNAPSQ